jgi:hypothetical protein
MQGQDGSWAGEAGVFLASVSSGLIYIECAHLYPDEINYLKSNINAEMKSQKTQVILLKHSFGRVTLNNL